MKLLIKLKSVVQIQGFGRDLMASGPDRGYAFYLAVTVFLKIDLTFKNRTIYITFWASGFSCKTKLWGHLDPVSVWRQLA